MLVPGGDTLGRSNTQKELTSSDDLAVAFLRAWESGWSEAHRFTQDELRVIRCNLYGVVTDRYSKQGEMTFTSKELGQAIKSARELVKPINTSFRPTGSINQICYNFVDIFFAGWKERDNFSSSEQRVIITHLYASTLSRYEASNQAVLKFTKRELSIAKDAVINQRAKKEKEARADERDRQIRRLRNRFGSADERRFTLHD